LGNKNFSKSLRRTKAKSRKDSPGWISPWRWPPVHTWQC
jgi:hypothetical protein